MWISIKDKVPDSAIPQFLVYSEDFADVRIIDQEQILPSKEWFMEGRKVESSTFNYWMPLPGIDNIESSWMGIDKEIPNPEQYRCLVYHPDYGIRTARWGASYNFIAQVASGWEVEGFAPPARRNSFTHWQPLPDIPTDQVRGQD